MVLIRGVSPQSILTRDVISTYRSYTTKGGVVTTEATLQSGSM